MASRYIRRAVEQLASYIRTQLPTHLDTVESEESLTSGSLENPVQVFEGDAPKDNRSPLVQVFADSWEFLDQRQRLMEVKCTVAVSLTSDADVAALAAKVDRYVTALLLCLTASPSLGGTVNLAMPTTGDRNVERGDSSMTRQIFFQDVLVHVQEQ